MVGGHGVLIVERTSQKFQDGGGSGSPFLRVLSSSCLRRAGHWDIELE